jgi:hypothetical protein
VYADFSDSLHLTFQASGSLWQDALVMQDLETKSLWSQITGECISGSMTGARLVQHPAKHMTFTRFKQTYPDGKLLSREKAPRKGSPYDDYFSDKSKLGIFGRVNDFTRLDGKDTVFGLHTEYTTAAVSKSYLEEHGMEVISGKSVSYIVTYDGSTESVAAFVIPSVLATDSVGLSLSGGKLVTRGGVAWDALTGGVIQGRGAPLKAAPIMTAYWFAWISFYPETDLIK